ncbi:uncharacterized protein LACBIDRAFT_305531 [Laccaria bicolor S238N-H82]|uniref:Predicted protein n=1 Tax=Laccaria bicolor (strain S238N-H82 / ATCC MYA-4686) TaxID=486041 RepID=B0CUH0_LACBS|nr:uncharacterized protein LACBIDRAFT_305531 [Laccaria bicolor S238N-H82]EDR14669.1 predicted protein [Laccaria bicolor S238N-H82]|eukprot:XP_001875228.1 predicted protein [Laccaria bicolor S238N-H82]
MSFLPATLQRSLRRTAKFPRVPPWPPTYPRTISSTAWRNARYVRFGQPTPQPRNHWDYRQWGPRVQLGAVILVLGTGYYVTHLEQVPQTGRWRFMNTSSKAEAELGEFSRDQTRREMGAQALPLNHPVTRHVRRVVSRILLASNLGTLSGETSFERETGLAGFAGFDAFGRDTSHSDVDLGASAHPSETYGPTKEWEVLVVNDRKTVNALAVPGMVVVFTGILPVCQDEEGLAAVVAHEIGHVVARHTAERMSSQTVIWGLLFLLQITGLDYGLFSLFQTFLMELPNSRTQEREADMIGLRLMSRACYDPAASPSMFNRLGKIEAKISKLNLDFLNTHPSSASRVKYLEEALPEGYSIMAANPECGGMRKQIQAFRGGL